MEVSVYFVEAGFNGLVDLVEPMFQNVPEGLKTLRITKNNGSVHHVGIPLIHEYVWGWICNEILLRRLTTGFKLSLLIEGDKLRGNRIC